MSDPVITGRIHSFQCLGAVDGPGLRFVFFLQGCPLRCMYCHNPDTWNRNGGTEYTVDEVVAKVLRYRTYFGEDGGVTVSGGEALLQAPFVTELFRALKSQGINTCLDTSGLFHSASTPAGPESDSIIGELLEVTDLVICDIKFTTDDDYRARTQGSLSDVLSFLSLTQKHRVPLWVRHVVVPGFTDTEPEIDAMISLAKRFDNLKRIELLPFRKLCVTKYESLRIPFPCAEIPECPAETIETLSRRIPQELR